MNYELVVDSQARVIESQREIISALRAALECAKSDKLPGNFLAAELQAQGVESFAVTMHADISEEDAREFAAKLRSEPFKLLELSSPLFIPPCAVAPSKREKIGGCDWLDWNQLSAMGLIVRINREILHPLGLALFRSPENGVSEGAMISPDGKWEYSADIKKGGDE